MLSSEPNTDVDLFPYNLHIRCACSMLILCGSVCGHCLSSLSPTVYCTEHVTQLNRNILCLRHFGAISPRKLPILQVQRDSLGGHFSGHRWDLISFATAAGGDLHLHCCTTHVSGTDEVLGSPTRSVCPLWATRPLLRVMPRAGRWSLPQPWVRRHGGTCWRSKLRSSVQKRCDRCPEMEDHIVGAGNRPSQDRWRKFTSLSLAVCQQTTDAVRAQKQQTSLQDTSHIKLEGQPREAARPQGAGHMQQLPCTAFGRTLPCHSRQSRFFFAVLKSLVDVRGMPEYGVLRLGHLKARDTFFPSKGLLEDSPLETGTETGNSELFPEKKKRHESP